MKPKYPKKNPAPSKLTKAHIRSQSRKILRDRKQRNNFAKWSNQLWYCIQNRLKEIQPQLVGSFIPLQDEPQLPIQPSFAYPQVLDENEMIYCQLDSQRAVEPDLVLVPGLAFYQKYRLGRGAGYFDRYLEKHPKVYRIGVAFEIQSKLSWLVDEWDIPMHEVLFENGGKQ